MLPGLLAALLSLAACAAVSMESRRTSSCMPPPAAAGAEEDPCGSPSAMASDRGVTEGWTCEGGKGSFEAFEALRAATAARTATSADDSRGDDVLKSPELNTSRSDSFPVEGVGE